MYLDWSILNVPALGIHSRVVWSVLVVLLSAIAFSQWRSYRRLSHFKGPFWAQFTNLWMYHVISTKTQYMDLYEAIKKYGDLARVGPNSLITGDVEMLHRMNGARSPYTRAPIYAANTLIPHENNTFSFVDEAKHTQRRAQIATGYTGKDTDMLEARVDHQLSELMNLIRTKYISRNQDLRQLDLARTAGYFTMDTITDVAFSSPWGFLTKDEDLGDWFSMVEHRIVIVYKMSSIPWLFDAVRMPWVAKMTAKLENPSTGVAKLISMASRIVGDRFESDDAGQIRDMMGSFIRRGLTQGEAVSEGILQVIAASDTTATAIRSTLLYIITNPHVYRKLQAEIDSTRVVPGPIISDAQSKTLPYLQAVIREGVRILPPTASTSAKVVPKDGDTVNGVFIPGGTEIGISIIAVLRNKKVFGEDVEIFRPERWITDDEETFKTMEKSLNMIWGHGKYQCLGKDLAWMELNKIYFELLKHFDFTSVNPRDPWKAMNTGLWLQKHMYVKATLRE